MFNLIKQKEETIDEKIKRYEFQTHKEILKIISKLPNSRRESFMDRLTGNVYNHKTLTEEEKKILLEKYEAREYEFVLNIHKSLEEQKTIKYSIKQKFENPKITEEESSDEDEENEQEESLEEGKDESDDDTDEDDEDDKLNYNEEEAIGEDEDDIPEDNWNELDFFCEHCFESFRLTEEEKEKIDKNEIKEITCKKCGKKIKIDEGDFYSDEKNNESEEDELE